MGLELKVSGHAVASPLLIRTQTNAEPTTAHESPYLNKWNTGVLLQAGMTFTNEPGIYLENRFGVRHEDIYLVTETGDAELLSGRRARGAYDP